MTHQVGEARSHIGIDYRLAYLRISVVQALHEIGMIALTIQLSPQH
jgi:hypothetical protein